MTRSICSKIIISSTLRGKVNYACKHNTPRNYYNIEFIDN